MNNYYYAFRISAIEFVTEANYLVLMAGQMAKLSNVALRGCKALG